MYYQTMDKGNLNNNGLLYDTTAEWKLFKGKDKSHVIFSKRLY